MKKFYFIRHGESEMNVSGHWAGTTDTPLTALGRKQAKTAGQKAKNLKIDKILSSPLSRAYESAKIIAREIDYPVEDIEINPMLIERNFGSLEGTLWNMDVDIDGLVDAEKSHELIDRAKEVLDMLNKEEVNNVLVVSHGSLGRAIRHHLTDIAYESVVSPGNRIPNAEIVQWI